MGHSRGNHIHGLQQAVSRIAIAFIAFLSTTAQYADAQALENWITFTVYGAGVAGSAPGDPNGYANVKLRLSFETQALFYNIQLFRVAEPTAIFIYQGDATTSSSSACQIADLFSVRDYLKSPAFGEYRIAGALPVSAGRLSDIQAGPEGFFLQVNNVQYPKGAVRGQLGGETRGQQINFYDVNLDNPP